MQVCGKEKSICLTPFAKRDSESQRLVVNRIVWLSIRHLCLSLQMNKSSFTHEKSSAYRTAKDMFARIIRPMSYSNMWRRDAKKEIFTVKYGLSHMGTGQKSFLCHYFTTLSIIHNAGIIHREYLLKILLLQLIVSLNLQVFA